MNYKPTRLKFVVGGNKKYFGAVFNFSEVRDRYKSMNEVSSPARHGASTICILLQARQVQE